MHKAYPAGKELCVGWEGMMISIRRRFMDMLYAVTIGGSMQLLEPHRVDGAFIFSIILLIITLEDFFLYYADVAPENTGAEGWSFFGMVSEIAILTSWFFAFSSFIADSWIFALYISTFFYLKTLGGFINCAVTGDLMKLKFLRELLFLLGAGVATWLWLYPPTAHPSEATPWLAALAGAWFIQTALWWWASIVVRRWEGRGVILKEASADTT